jgi:hemoglobin
MASLFEAIGGKEAVNLAVDKFYEKVLADQRVNHFFANTDMGKQKAHQQAFFTYAFGGTDKYDGQSMRAAHQKLVTEMGLNEQHFDAIAEDLVLTLKELGVSAELIAKIVAIAAAESHKKDVLNQ